MHQETFGKSGCRRIVPGQYLAVDPKGRAVMIGAVEKQKLVYILNRLDCCLCVCIQVCMKIFHFCYIFDFYVLTGEITVV